jgi:hypothetical protein
MGEQWSGWRREMHTALWWEPLKETDHLEDLGLDGNNIKMELQYS